MTKIPQQELEQARSNIVSTIQSYGVELKSYGKYHKALCPFHSEKTPSFTVYQESGRFKCFGCDAEGDSIQFVMDLTGCEFPSAVQAINGSKTITHTHTKQVVSSASEKKWSPMAVVPKHATTPPDQIRRRIDDQWVPIDVQERWSYKNEHGDITGYVVRLELPNGKKEVLPQTYCINQDGECEWRTQGFAHPRPIFGLDVLASEAGKDVLIVEGEKTCCAAKVIYPNMTVISWMGGTQAIKTIDWLPLVGRNIYLWPDADQKLTQQGEMLPFPEQVGTKAMLDIYHKLGKPENCWLVIPPSGVESGWDLADTLPDGFEAAEYIKNALQCTTLDFEKKTAPTIPQPNIIKSVNKEHDFEICNPYFKILGYDHGYYHIMQHQRGQIDAYSVGSLTDKGLISLAPLEWWESNFSSQKGGINIPMAVNYILRIAEAKGIYDTDKIRGRGAWIDKKSVVFHHGNILTVDGKQMALNAIESNYVYEMGKSFPPLPDESLSDEDGARIFELATDFRWTMPGSGVLLAGWLALAPICGALKWRPHIWLQGGPGAGKSTLLSDFIHPLLNNISMYALGSTTEASLRQHLKSDAIPVLFDESESSKEKDSLRIQSVLALMRQSSSESQAKVFKGSANGMSISYHLRSMFCLSSIQTALEEQADKERVTILSLRPKIKKDQGASDFWQFLLHKLNALKMDGELPGRLIQRSIRQLPNTLQNIKIFVEVAAQYFGIQREGDQYGTLLAGAWSLISNQIVTKSEALEYIKMYDWTEYRENSENDDSETAFNTLMSTFIKVPGYQDISVSTLILMVCGRHVTGIHIPVNDAIHILGGYGMKIAEGNSLIICQNHLQLKNLMKNTPFHTDLKSVLLRYKGAKKLEKPSRFNGILARALSLPLNALLDEDAEVEL